MASFRARGRADRRSGFERLPGEDGNRAKGVHREFGALWGIALKTQSHENSIEEFGRASHTKWPGIA